MEKYLLKQICFSILSSTAKILWYASATLTTNMGKTSINWRIKTSHENNIKILDEDNYYKYLDILQADIKDAEVKKTRMPNVSLKNVQVFVVIIFIQALGVISMDSNTWASTRQKLLYLTWSRKVWTVVMLYRGWIWVENDNIHICCPEWLIVMPWQPGSGDAPWIKVNNLWLNLNWTGLLLNLASAESCDWVQNWLRIANINMLPLLFRFSSKF